LINVYEDIYEERKNSPLWWYNKSSDLHASAGAIWVSMDRPNSKKIVRELAFSPGFDMGVACWPVYQMLCGLSFELIFKGVAVAKGNQPLYDHILTAHADSSGIDYSDKECSLLATLTESIIWDGKYPIPKKRDTLEKHYKNAPDALSDGALDWQSYDSMWRKATTKFFQLHKS
jgi:hypothetical protein